MSLPARPDPPRPHRRKVGLPGGLSGRLLLLTVLFVVTAQLLILAPSLAAFQDRWLSDRIRTAELASLALDAAPAQIVTDDLAAQLLEGAGVISVAVRDQGVRSLLLAVPRLQIRPRTIDLRRSSGLRRLAAPFETLARPDGGFLRVVDEPRFREGDAVEIIVQEGPLRAGLLDYLIEVAASTVFTGVLAGALVYLTLNLVLVRPMQSITGSMERFRADPDDPDARVPLSGRSDEIGRAEAALSRMQTDLRAALHARARLAALGEAVAKINHDLRNMLTAAQIASDRLAASGDPAVAQAMPRLERALERAVSLAQNTLAYGRSEEPPPSPRTLTLRPALEAAGEDAGLSPDGVRLEVAAPERLPVRVDPEHLHRILVNLLRNAREAVESTGRSDGRVRASASRVGGIVTVRLADDGPGLPPKARARLFQPFSTTTRSGGAGLGLAISRELAQANNGDLQLADTGAEGTTFELKLPAG